MKRTELLALAERLSQPNGSPLHIYEGLCPDKIEGLDSRDPKCPACRQLRAADKAAAILRQIAQAQPVGWACTQKNGDNHVFANPCLSSNPEYVKLYHYYNWRPIYALPLED